MPKKGFGESDVVHYGTLDELDRLTRSQITVSLISQRADFPEGILDSEFVESRRAPGHRCFGDACSLRSNDSCNPEAGHALVEHIRELMRLADSSPELIGDTSFADQVRTAGQAVQTMAEIIEIIDPGVALDIDLLHTKMGLGS
jgi:hypothetical protein